MRTYSRQLSCIIIVLCVAFSVKANDISQTVSLVGDPWPPYMLGELGQQATGGVGHELMKVIFERLNSKFKKSIILSSPMVPWKRALREVEQGSKDGIGILLKTPEREKYMVYTDVLFHSHNVAWYKQSKFPSGFNWDTYEDFKGYTIGGIRGHSNGTKFDKLVAEGALEIVEVSSAEQLFAMLDKGRFDLAIVNKLVGASLAQKFQQPAINLMVSPKPVHVEVYYIAFSRKSNAQKLIPAINAVISDMKSEGEIQRIIHGSTVQNNLLK